MRTADGILVIEVNEPDPDLYVDGEKVTITWQNGGVKAEVRVKPGTRKVELKKGGFRAFGGEVTLDGTMDAPCSSPGSSPIHRRPQRKTCLTPRSMPRSTKQAKGLFAEA